MRLLFILVILKSFFIIGYGQDSVILNKSFRYKNSIQTELFGHGFLYSLNYERAILNNPIFKTTGQVGFSYYPPGSGIKEFWIPILVNELISFNKHHIEIGFGYVFTEETVSGITSEDNSDWGGFVTGRIGYRYQNPSKRLLFRIGFTPFFEYGDLKEFHPSGGLAVGYSF